MVTLLCTVRDCHGPLRLYERSMRCEQGHSFDVARNGYINLLQPQDRRSRNPGDSKDVVNARRRWLDSGHERNISQVLASVAAGQCHNGAVILDVGCGEGSHLAALSALCGGEGHGLDISVPAIDAAARRHPDQTWVVANADRFLPYGDHSFDLLLSVTSRRNAAEFRRVSRRGAHVLLIVPGPDDLVELRESVLGRGLLRSRADALLGGFTEGFVLERRETVRHVARLEQHQIVDLLTTTYRGARASQRELVSRLEAQQVTLSRELFLFRCE